MEKIIIHSDGGARGNPGPAAAAFAAEFTNSKNQITKYKKAVCIGTATNNQAEYKAVIEALKWVKENINCHSERSEESVANATTPIRERSFEQSSQDDNLEIEFLLDSELVVEQLNQRYKIKNEGLKPLFWEIRDLIMELGGNVTFKHIRREENKEADKLVNKALDKQIGKS